MKAVHFFPALMMAGVVFAFACRGEEVVFEKTTPYHHIRVVDNDGLRMLCFDDGRETQMSLQDPMRGHFEYTEYFHMCWLWNTNITNVLMIGLGGGSTQRSFEHYYPDVTIQSVEIDPMVLRVAKEYFQLHESERQKVQVEDGRMFLRRSSGRYDAVLLDAYVQGRYGGSIPQHLATKEFFELVREHLTANGVVAYNVIGTLHGWRADIVGAIYRTLGTVFPHVYLFPARGSQNVVILAAREPGEVDLDELRVRANRLVLGGQVRLPTFRDRVEVFQARVPASVSRSPVLTDDYAPVEGLIAGAGRSEETNSPPAK